MTEPSGPALAAARSGTYRLLARLALAEVDDELADRLAGMPIFGAAFAESGGRDALQALRVEYARTLLMNVQPYESVYLDESGMLNASRSAAVLAHYQEHDFEPTALRSSGAPDHLGLELEFMAFLVDQEAEALAGVRQRLAAELRAEQIHFLAEHLVSWAPVFGRALADLSGSPFYRALGQAVETFVLGDYQALAGESTGDEAGT